MALGGVATSGQRFGIAGQRRTGLCRIATYRDRSVALRVWRCVSPRGQRK